MIKLHVDVTTPGNGKRYEFQLDGSLSADQAKQMIIEQIVEVESGGITLNSDKCIMCNMSTSSMLTSEQSLSSLGVRSGHTLILL